MRIIHVMDHSLPRSDGYSIRAKYLLEAQAAAGHEVTVLTSPSQGDAEGMQVDGVTYRRSAYSPWEAPLVAKGAKHLVFRRVIARVLAPLVAQQHFDLIHAHTPVTVARVALAQARKSRLPFVYEKRNLWEESARARGKSTGQWPWYQVARTVDDWVTKRADAVCTITEALRQSTIDRGVSADRVFVVGNGVDVTAFAPRPPLPELRERCLQGGNFVLGFVGSFYRFEGLPMLVEAFALLRTRFAGARLVLVGDGEDRARVDALVDALGLRDSVWVVGSVPHDQVADFYASMDALAYPRYKSTLTDMISPLKPLEPMAMARCVIGSDVGGIRELINHKETGLIFPAGSVLGLADATSLILSGQFDAARLGRNAREFVVQHRQWQQMATHYELAYAHAIGLRHDKR